jgi:hypothetical protein
MSISNRHRHHRPGRGGQRWISTLVPILGAVLLLGACYDQDRHIGWERERLIIGPIALKDKVAYVDSARDRVFVVDVGEATPRVYTYRIGRRAIFATPTPDRTKLAVVTRGEEAVVEGQVDEDPTLWMVDLSAPDTEPIGYPIGSPFDRLAVSADGNVAVAYFSSSGPDSQGFFRNPNEMAAIDLSRGPAEDNPTLKTIRSFGSVPDGVVLAPPLVLPGAPDTAPRTFAFILALNNVTVFDATNPDRHEVSIRLDLGGEPVRPREVVFAPNTATAYLRSDNARDVLEILLSYEEPSDRDPLDNDFQPALAELGAGGGPADVAVYDDSSGQRFILAATPNTRQVVVIDADTGQFSTVDTPDPIDRVLLFPNDPDQVPKYALLASIGSRLSRVHLLALDGITDELVRADLTTISLDQPVLDVVPVPNQELGMIVHDDNRTVLGLLDVAFGSVSPLQGVGKLDSYAFSLDGSYLIGATDGVSRVGFLDLANLHPSDMRLDHPPETVLTLPSGKVFADHGDPYGHVTIIPSPTADRADAIVLSGFLLDDLLSEDF